MALLVLTSAVFAHIYTTEEVSSSIFSQLIDNKLQYWAIDQDNIVTDNVILNVKSLAEVINKLFNIFNGDP